MRSALRLDHVGDLGEHATHGRRVLQDDRAAHPREAQAAQRCALARGAADGAPPQGGLDDALAHPRSSPTVLPRSAATWSGGRSSRSAAIVARTMLFGLFEPMHLVRTLASPASSTTARTPPPAITPVPSEAGLSSTSPAPKRPITSKGMVPSTSGTSTMLFLAFSIPLRIASGTSFALPRPNPTRPALSPTTTSALKLKRRPPLTTLATRLMWTTFSFSSVPRSSTIRRGL